MTTRRILKWLAGLSGFCVLLLAAFVLLLPRIVDGQAVKETVQTFLLTRTSAQVTIENIDLHWFPRPTVVIRGASLAYGDQVSGKIRSLAVGPAILGLLRGRMEVSQLEVTSPALSVHLPEPEGEAFNVDAIESQIRSLLASLTEQTPEMVVIINDGTAKVRIGDRPPLVIAGLDGRLAAPPGAMDLRLSARANVFDALRVEAKITGGTLETKGRIKMERLHLQEAMAALFPRPEEYVESGDVSLEIGLTAIGLGKIKAEIDGSLPSLGLARRGQKTVIEGSAFKGVISRDGGSVNAVIERLDIVSPRLSSTGELTVAEASSAASLKWVGREIDISSVRELALKIAGDIEGVDELFRHVQFGKIPEISVQTAGGSFAELRENIGVIGSLRDARILTHALDIDLEEVNGFFAVSSGILEARDFSARLGNIQGSHGTLRLGLEGQSAPFHLDVMVQTRAAELHSLLLRIVKNGAFHKKLSRVRNIEGDLSGRLILGDRLDDFLPKISITKSAVRGSYDMVPYPLSIKAGRFEYGPGKIALQDVSGAVGLSSFADLTGSLSYDEARSIEIGSGKFSLDVAQTKNLLNIFEVLTDELKDVDFAQGRLDLTSLSLKGSLDDPGRWNFTGAGTFDKLAVKHAQLPGVMNLSGGKFSATPAKLTVSNTRVNLLDAALIIDGSLDSPEKTPLSLAASAAGSIGAEMTGWLSRQIELPKQFMLRSPLQVTQARVLWKQDGDVAFTGDLTVDGGPRLSLDMVRTPQTMEIKEILIVDGGQRARMTFDLKKDNFAFSFNGSIEKETLNRIFQVPPLEGSLVQGDFQISAFSQAPLRFNARGRLAGRGLRIPLKDAPVVAEFFFIEADQSGVNVRSADLRWQNSRVSFMGKLLAEAKALRFDMDVSADRIVWEEISELVQGEGNRKNSAGILGMALPPLDGALRLKANNFTFAGYNWRPLQARIFISPKGIRGAIERGNLCGIDTVGKVDFADGKIGLDLSLSATDGQLESTSRCLTENKFELTGSYSLKAQVAGQGTPESLARTLRGEFDFSARDGQFPWSPNVDTALERTFDYLNNTGDFDVAFPDLDKESFPFRSFRSRGTVEGMTLINDELAIQSSLFTVTGMGKVDFANDEIDVRGLVTVRVPGSTMVTRIPLVGSILGIGGSILGIPVRVVGPLENPNVTYLSPTSVGAELLNIPGKILGLPVEAIRLFTPSRRDPQRE